MGITDVINNYVHHCIVSYHHRNVNVTFECENKTILVNWNCEFDLWIEIVNWNVNYIITCIPASLMWASNNCRYALVLLMCN